MKDKAKHILIYTGSEVSASHIVNLLKETGINPIVKNEFQQAILSGFGANYNQSVEVWIADYEQDQANKIIKDNNKLIC